MSHPGILGASRPKGLLETWGSGKLISMWASDAHLRIGPTEFGETSRIPPREEPEDAARTRSPSAA